MHNNVLGTTGYGIRAQIVSPLSFQLQRKMTEETAQEVQVEHNTWLCNWCQQQNFGFLDPWLVYMTPWPAGNRWCIPVLKRGKRFLHRC